MDRASVSENLVVLRLSEDEPLSPAHLTQLLRQSLVQAGLSPWAAADTELFSAGGETLLIARRRQRLYIVLENLEDLLAALVHCPPDTALYTWPEGWLLALEGGTGGLWPREFGNAIALSPDWELHAREQGLCLSRDAARELLPHFGVQPLDGF